jgi:uncharacterized protein (TIGR00661 family)
MLTAPLELMYSNADRYLVSAFFQPPPIDPSVTEVFPPILQREVNDYTPKEGEHALVYQTSPTFHRLFDALKRIPRKFIIYGFGKKPTEKNLEFKAPSRHGFLEDLASCRYAITNGGHNVISEALLYGKPVFSFPIHFAYEQFVNAHMLGELGYGEYSLVPNPDSSIIIGFEKRLESFAEAVSGGDFFGNEKLASYLEALLTGAV